MTIGDLDEVIEWVVCVSNEVFLPAMTLRRTSSPESSDSSRWGSGVIQIISEKFHQRSSELRKRLLGGQPPTPPSETNKELQGTANVFVSNILKRAKEDLFSSGEDDLETTNPGTTLTVERLSSIFSQLFRDASESAQENARRIHHMRSGSRNNSRSRSLTGSSQGSSRYNMPELALNLCQLVECVDAEPNPMLSLEHPSVSCSDSSGLHPLPEQGWMEEHIGSALLGQLSTIQADMGELENLTRPLPLANGDDSSSNRSSGSSTAASPSTCLYSPDVASEGRALYSWSRSGSSQGSRWFNLCHQAEEMERFDLQRDPLCSSVSVVELGSVRWPKGRGVHKALSEGSLPVFALLGERPGEVGETSSPAGEMDETQTASTPSIPRSGHGGRRSSQTTTPTTGHREAGVTTSNIFDVINHLTHSDTDRKLNQEFSSEDDVSLNDIMDMKFTPAVEPLGQILSSWRLVNRIFRRKVHYFGKELICKVYQMLLDTGMGRKPMARQSRSEPILKDLAANHRLSNEFFTDVLYMFIQRAIKNLLENFLGLPTTPPGRDIMWNDNFNWMFRDGCGDTCTSSEEELWDSDSTWSRGLGEEEGAEPLGRWAAQLERGSSLTLQSSGSLSDDNKEALGAICQVLTTMVGDILNRTCNDDYKARLIIQKRYIYNLFYPYDQ
ncbi:uncharacterized protein LOC121532551 [Coregonus clupeaformis]|uniref:uncharacterized protein LOC121532551 n=1 Tax=Coregonus clupeaformis TaxID=59861 RepID=UPI001E1C52A4|nr:uncharacterized protein LOC121532551 [Coregonus clupeaformis]XP_045071909.1 uncharacterized protein LOC121532551 [Coregonus clupeaformis]XP_045071910.1 uncharacterized protein LOC121532551 [Coregonus clupeaformis]